MAEVTMTLYEALSRKKILEDKVSSKAYRVVEVVKKADLTSTSEDIVKKMEKLNSDIQAGYSSMISNFNNLTNLKAAINDANARIQVEIAGKTYSIANAIVRQRSIDTEERYYTSMLANINACNAEIARTNDKNLSSDAIANYVAVITRDQKKDEALINALKEGYIKDNEVVLYDPLNTEELAKAKLEEIKLFKEQIHYVLTQANCSNPITVEFED